MESWLYTTLSKLLKTSKLLKAPESFTPHL